MESFIERHRDRILGALSGFDRILFRGTLRSISYAEGALTFLCAKGILLKDFIPFAQQCTKELVAHAEKIARDAQRPYLYLNSTSIRKEDYAREIAERDGIKKGLVCVLYCVEPCMGFDIHRNREQKMLQLVSRQRKCRFFYFYLMDREFGLMHVRLQSWFPFEIQICLNGRSFLAQQMDREGIAYKQVRNGFTWIDDLPRAQKLIDRLNRRNWVRTLARLAERANPLLDTRLRDVYPYYWTIRQCEYATDILFKDRSSLAAIYPHLWQHAMTHFLADDLMRFLGKKLTRSFPSEAVTDVKRRPEGLRIKHAVDRNSIKMYDKNETILRIETTINNPRWFRVLRDSPETGGSPLAWRPMRLGVSDIQRRVDVSLAANSRYLEALAVVGEPTPSHQILDAVSKPVRNRTYRYRALRPICPIEAKLLQAILQGQHLIHGFTNRNIRARVFPSPSNNQHIQKKRSSYVSRYIRLFRAHGLITKVPCRHLYRITKKGHQVMTTALTFRQTDAALLLPKQAA